MTKVKALTKAFAKLKGVETAEDLKRVRLSPFDFEVAWSLLQELHTKGSAGTFIKPVADFFAGCGFAVKMDEHGINYLID